MAESPSNEDSPLPANLINIVLVLITVVGGFWYFTNKLTSNRPVALPGKSADILGEQKVEARLWEDPLKDADESRKPAAAPATETNTSLSSLIGQLIYRWGGNTGAKPRPDAPGDEQNSANLKILIDHIDSKSKAGSKVLLLPVMVEDGRYSEDRESRIRSRLAVISGLGVKGFVPSDAEHIGRVWLNWPSEDQLERFITSSNVSPLPSLHELSSSKSNSVRLDLRYEWFQPRDFSAGAGAHKIETNVLVLWLGESFFDDYPLLRWPMLFDRLYYTNADRPEVKLIGPVHSVTMQAMLPKWDTGRRPEENLIHSDEISKLLMRLDIFCASPRAIDEVLVRNAAPMPRESIRTNLEPDVVHSFHNFAITDSQLAREACEELALRGAPVTDPKNHIVLITEWDTFFGRMASLTYQARIGFLQHKATNLNEYIEKYRSAVDPKVVDELYPSNFWAYYFLRGLDGQTIGTEGQTSDAKSRGSEGQKTHPTSVDDFRQWKPDANKAEGQSQLDYVGRLGDEIKTLDENLKHADQGQIKAIGVVGSDIYDTLIILQALRKRFPASLFFTTDLDARFLDPQEQDWTRNLIVVAGYGLALNPKFQEGVPPFRDSEQTAQYAATLAALGDTDLINLPSVPPRRFEIGREGLVNLSVRKDATPLHPPTFIQAYKKSPYLKGWKHLWPYGVLAGLLVMGAVVFYDPIARSTWKMPCSSRRTLEYDSKDFGGPEGASVFLRRLQASGDPACQEICRVFGWKLGPGGPEVFFNELQDLESRPSLNRKEQSRLEEMRVDLVHAMAAGFNELLLDTVRLRPILRNSLISGVKKISVDWSFFWVFFKIPYPGRRCLDLLLEKSPVPEGSISAFISPARLDLLKQQGKGTLANSLKARAEDCLEAAMSAAGAAREAAQELFWDRLKRMGIVLALLFVALIFAIALGWNIWQDTFVDPLGQGFSLGNGASGWPAQIVRFVALVTAAYSCVAIFFKQSTAFAKTTREFRFPVELPKSVPPGRVCAVKIWTDYTGQCKLGNVVLWAVMLIVPHCALLVSIFWLGGGLFPFNPIRGPRLASWNFCLLIASVIAFVILTVLTIQASQRCRKFILALCERPTEYPDSTRRHFARDNGNLSEGYLDEWIDVQLIGQLTEYIGGIVYYPFIVLSMLIIARNDFWDNWPWPSWLVAIFITNAVLAIASVFILQLAAEKAKKLALAQLTAKVKRSQALAAPNKQASDSAQAEKLLAEIKDLKQGAFAPSWQSPVFGAVLLPSSAYTIFQGILMALGH